MEKITLLFDEHYFELVEKSSNILFEEILGSAQKAYLIAKLSEYSKKNIVIVTQEGVELTKLKNDIAFFTQDEVLEFQALDIASSKEVLALRQKTLATLHSASSSHGVSKIVVASLQSTLQKIPSREAIATTDYRLCVGALCNFDEFIGALERFGYRKTAVTTSKGDYSVRGGIVDIFSIDSEYPFRVEFFGDEIESLRTFDPHSQKSFEKVSSITLLAFSVDQSDSETLFSLFDKKETIIVLDDVEVLEDRYADFSGYNAILEKNDLQKSSQITFQEWFSHIEAMSSYLFISKKQVEELIDQENVKKREWSKGQYRPEKIEFSLFDRTWNLFSLPHPFESLAHFYCTECLYDTPPLGELLLDAYTICQKRVHHTFILQSEVEKIWIEEKLNQRGLSLKEDEISFGYLSNGFVRRDTKESFIPISELLGTSTSCIKKESPIKAEFRAVSSQSQMVTGFDAYSLEPQDSVVHFHHGIGTFLGIEKRQNGYGIEQEFFIVEYAEKAKLYVPLHHAHLLTKYIGAGESIPRLHTLGATRWKKLREDTEKAIVGYASELLKAYAQRTIAGGIQYPEDSSKMKLFETEFSHQETHDQLQAIYDIKRDMCSTKAMDRLICGDVGYGKTEVAMRGAFKAVVDGKKQVAVLVPTTVLALQHYENFRNRMEPFGVRLALLSRFQSQKQNKETVQKIAAGDIDIIIGTHKLIQKGISFYDLGLVIVDEEQRFGVKAKEHLKVIKHGVDCITLSATPIPRTLYMSLVGARDLSTIATPPYDRLPVQSIVMEFHHETLQMAIVRELNRGGQVFYIHNRVETILQACERVQKMVPRAKIAAVHGQMESDTIDSLFQAFRSNEIDILVATTIIENGIDIPNANTIIIERADQFGLSELYQMRGRVGRSDKRAFAYFLTPPNRSISEVSQKRLHAISQSGGYGGGLKIAMRDLEIRGAGDILGVDQSGHVATIGFHLYCKLLKRSVESLQGKKSVIVYDTKVDVPYLAKLSEEYIDEISLRVEIYQRLGDVESEQEVISIQQEMIDRFGKLPYEAEWLVMIARIRVLAALKGITLIKIIGPVLTLERKNGKELSLSQKRVPKYESPSAFYEHIKSLI